MAKVKDMWEMQGFLYAILGEHGLGSAEGETVSADNAPRAVAHLRAILGKEFAMNYVLMRQRRRYVGAKVEEYLDPDTLTQRRALAEYLRSIADMLEEGPGRSVFSDVLDFSKAFDTPRLEAPGFPDEAIIKRRLGWCKEEIEEIEQALDRRDLVGVIDGYADLIYFAVGAGPEYGVVLTEPWNLVHQANMDKLGPDGKPVKVDGKVQKPFGWIPPDARIAEYLRTLGYVPAPPEPPPEFPAAAPAAEGQYIGLKEHDDVPF